MIRYAGKVKLKFPPTKVDFQAVKLAAETFAMNRNRPGSSWICEEWSRRWGRKASATLTLEIFCR